MNLVEHFRTDVQQTSDRRPMDVRRMSNRQTSADGRLTGVHRTADRRRTLSAVRRTPDGRLFDA